MRRLILAFLATTALTAPNISIGATTEEFISVPSSEPIPAVTPTASPAEEAIQSAKVYYSNNGSTQRATIVFKKRPEVFGSKSGPAETDVTLAGKFTLSNNKVPGNFSKSFVSISVSESKDGNIIAIRHPEDSKAEVSYSGNSMNIDVTLPVAAASAVTPSPSPSPSPSPTPDTTPKPTPTPAQTPKLTQTPTPAPIAAKPGSREEKFAAIKSPVGKPQNMKDFPDDKEEINIPEKSGNVEIKPIVKVEVKPEVKAAPKPEVVKLETKEPPKPEVKEVPKPTPTPTPTPITTPKSEVKETPKPAPAPAPTPTPTPKPEVKEAPKVEAKVEEKKPTKAEIAKNGKKITPKVEFTRDGDIERLKFTFSGPAPAPAAVFERFGYYWLVFYTDDQLDLPDGIKKSQLFASAKKVAAVKAENINEEGFPKVVKNPLIYNLELKKSAYSLAEKNDNEWIIEFDPNIKYEHEGPLKLEEKADNWQLATKGISGRVTVRDEFTNDYLDVFPLSEPGSIADKTSSNKFTSESTVQGFVIKPIGQVQVITDEKDKIKIHKEAPTEKADDNINADIKKPKNPGKPLFAFQKWEELKSDDYRAAENKLKNGDRFEFGKFLFSQGLYSESAVNLEGVRGMEASFLTGASYFMLGRFEDAAKIFDSLNPPEGVDANELLLWKAADNYELYQVNPGAAKTVDLADFYLPHNVDNYPDKIRNRLLFSVVGKLINDVKYDDAQAFLNVMPKTSFNVAGQNFVKYLQGKIFDGQGKHDRARALWDEASKAKTDRESQAKAAYELIMQDYTSGKTKIDEAIKQLNAIRILWRGDMFEYNLLNQLGDLYEKNGNDYEALVTYKEILSSFPRFPHNIVIASNMGDIYTKALDKNFADKEKTFRAVTIYYEFEELKPAGEKGDQLTLQLADALAKYDLLNDSAKVLQKYFGTLTDPAQKAEIGARIAILNFLDNKPKDALEVLKNSGSANIPSYLAQERKILQVRCLIEIGDYEKAMSLLSALPDEQATRFKTDIFWKQKKWQEMIDVYNIIPEKTDDDIMRMAMGYVLLDDKKSLGMLDKQFSDRMAKGQYAQSFEFVTDTDNVDFRNLEDSLKLDKTEEVLKKYRDKLKSGGLQAVTGKNGPDAPKAEAKPAMTKPEPDAAKAGTDEKPVDTKSKAGEKPAADIKDEPAADKVELPAKPEAGTESHKP